MIKPYRDCFTTSVAEKLKWFKQCLWDGELSHGASLALEELLHGCLEEDIRSQIGVGRHERGVGRLDQRNGYYQRTLESSYGPVTLRVPRSRKNLYEPTVFEAYQRRTAVVEQAICDLFTAGVSTRRVGEILELICGVSVSAATVSQVCKALDRHVRAYQQRPLQDCYQYLLLDGIHLRCKGADGPKGRVVLVAYGFTAAGKRELIAFRQVPGESEQHCSAFLEDLRRRGLQGDNLRLISTDGGAGMLAALNLVYPFVPLQRCWAHKLRNVAGKLRQANQKACLKEAKTIYLAATERDAIRRYRRWKSNWEALEPKAVACLQQDIQALLSFFIVPPEHRIWVRTTNAIERSFREVRRRTKPMSCFNNPASIDRIVFAVFSHLNANWEKRSN